MKEEEIKEEKNSQDIESQDIQTKKKEYPSILMFITVLIAALILSFAFFASYAERDEETDSEPGPCGGKKPEQLEKTSFYQVASKLDEGGNFYMYVSSEKFFNSAGDYYKLVKSMLKESANQENTESIKKADNILNLLGKFAKESGMLELSGVGVSSIAIEDGLYRSRVVLHHYKGEDKGKFWKLLGEKSHKLDTLKILPENTVASVFFDFKALEMAEWINSNIENSEIEPLKKGLGKAKQQLNKQKIDLYSLLKSMDNHFGFIITLSRENTLSLPVPGFAGMKVPEPAIAVVVKVKDSTLLDFIAEQIKSKLQMPVSISEDGQMKKLLLPCPPIPLNIEFLPQIVQKNEYMILASGPKLIKSIINSFEKGNGLISTEGFKNLSRGIPLKGNGFKYFSRRLGEEMQKIQQAAMKQSSDMSAEQMKMMKKLSEENLSDFFSVTQITDEGLVSTINSNFNAAQLMMIQATVAPAAIMAGMLLPALSSARVEARKANDASNLKQIEIRK